MPIEIVAESECSRLSLPRSLLDEAGMPPGVVNFLPGPGGSVGMTLVEHPKTRAIAFTGSMGVGLAINAQAAKTAEGQIWISTNIENLAMQRLLHERGYRLTGVVNDLGKVPELFYVKRLPDADA